MCGITALLQPGVPRADGALVERMGRTMRHRGPDGEGVMVDGPVALHHMRLSIIDLADGAQPMEADGLAVTYNGEIYNYVELRDELRARGHAFRTASDTEVLLRAYAEWGEACVDRLVGMFAFVLHDRPRGRLLVVRDRFGIKPLYWCRSGGTLAWASEIKALLRLPGFEADPDYDAIRDYLTFQFVLGPATLFRGVRKVLPGHLQVVDVRSGAVQERCYWEPRYPLREAVSDADAAAELRWRLEESVRLHLRSDVAVGSHLSGGLDSSLLTVLATRERPGPFPVFTGTFHAGPDFDETPYARAVAAATGAELHESVLAADELPDLLPRLIWHLDEPTAGPGVVPQFAVSRLAAQHVKVVLGGQGGDEVFGGYARYMVAYLEQALKGAIFETNEEAEHIVSLRSILPNLPHLQQYVPMLKQFWRHGLFEPMDRRYCRLVDRLGGATSLFTPEFRADYDADAVFLRFQRVFNHPETRSYYEKMAHFDLVTGLPALLQVEDRVSMAVSIESRVPLLDHRIVDFMATLPPRLKFRGGELKHLLKRAVGHLLPPAVMQRKDKMGFPVPLHHWSRGVSRTFFFDTLLSSRARTRGIVEPAEVEKLLTYEQAYSRQSWGLLNLELWFRTFIDQ